MKRTTRILALMSIVICAIGMTSCLGSDDDNNSNVLTPEEVKGYLMTMNGSYKGKILMDYQVAPYETKTERDSVMEAPVYVSAADTLIRMDFPTHLLAHVITGQPQLKEAVAETEDIPLELRILLTKSNNEKYILFYPIPSHVLKFNVFMDGKTHFVTLTFATTLAHIYNTFYSQGEYVKADGTLAFYILPYAMTLDETTTVSITSSPMLFLGQKLMSVVLHCRHAQAYP